jgi:GntP family gluconate:H+ symporter
LITGVAGCFGKILQNIGVSDIIAQGIAATHLPGIVLPFIISSLVLIAQGSATVALTTTAAIILPLLGALGISPELAVIAIAGGGMCGVFPQGSYFWCVTKMAGFDMKKGYVAVTATSFVMGGFAFVSILILSMFVK